MIANTAVVICMFFSVCGADSLWVGIVRADVVSEAIWQWNTSTDRLC